ncbi:MAG: sugar ABC transporter permease, partial [Caldilineaceae bacterium]|nr:sugar ABC transporter permease [Caldilineaceae bacterium]
MKPSRWALVGLLLPGIVVIAAIQLYPVLYTFWLSFRRTEAGTGRFLFVGLENFRRLLESSAFSESLVHTGIFLVGYVVLTMSVALGIALLLRERVRLTPLYITLLFLPWIISDVIAGIVWRLFVIPDYGQFSPFFANPTLFGEPNGISILTTTVRSPLHPDIPFPPAPALLYLIVAASWKILPFITL